MIALASWTEVIIIVNLLKRLKYQPLAVYPLIIILLIMSSLIEPLT